MYASELGLTWCETFLIHVSYDADGDRAYRTDKSEIIIYIWSLVDLLVTICCIARGKIDQSKPTNYVTLWIAGDN